MAIGKFDVTVAEFEHFAKSSEHARSGGCYVLEHGEWVMDDTKSFRDPVYRLTDRNPVVCVDWKDAQNYVRWLSEQTGHRYRLPNEAEFEYAARGGTTTTRWWGDSAKYICKYTNAGDLSFERDAPGTAGTNKTCDDGFGATSNPVSSFPANPFGLYDVLGNVLQWTGDCHAQNYDGAPSDSSITGTAGDCSKHSAPGGTWHNSTNYIRSALRGELPADMRASSVGFRIVRLPDR